ncbi:unnamed protein product [Camellia sinensis]
MNLIFQTQNTAQLSLSLISSVSLSFFMIESFSSNSYWSDVDKQFLAAPVKSAVDKFQLLPEFLKVRGLVKQHLDSFNYFVRTEIKKIVRANDLITSRVDPTIYLRYKDVWIGEPSMTIDGVTEKLSPHKCRLSDITDMYAAPIYVNIEYITGSHGQKTPPVAKNNVIIGRMPIMLRSCCCVLHGKDGAELARLGCECPLDPGGYFIIKGTEKVILIQEQLSKNRIIIDTDKKGCVQASVMSSTEATKSKTVIKMEKEKIYLYLNQFANKVPIMVVMKAMGMESDQEVVQMLGRDPRFGALLLPSIEEECASNDVYTQHQALEFLEKKVRKSPFSNSSFEKEGKALGILRDVFIANIPVRQNNFRAKCIYVAVMLRRMMEAILNKDAMDDKDYVGNKRLELSGQLLSLLFEDLFKTMNDEVKKTVDATLAKPSRSSRFDFSQSCCIFKVWLPLDGGRNLLEGSEKKRSRTGENEFVAVQRGDRLSLIARSTDRPPSLIAPIDLVGSNLSPATLMSDVDKQFLAAPVKSAVDKFQLLPEFLKVRGLVKQHLDSFNYFVRTEIKKIVRANDLITSRVDPTIYLRYKDVWIGEPSMTIDGVTEKLSPHKCRLSDITYAAPIYVNIEYITGSHGQKTPPVAKNNVIIGRMPIMLRSCCCVLHGKDGAELARLGCECPLDPGGYFIIKGTEKVILIQEQLSKNRIIIDTDKKGCVQASVMSSTEATKSKTVIKMEKEKIYLYLNQFANKVPIMVVMKAMGMESDQEVVQMLGRDPRFGALLLPSIEECASNDVYTQHQALEFLEKKGMLGGVRKSPFSNSSFEKEGKALGILRDVFIANIPVRQNNFRAKCIYVAVMLRRMMEAILNKDAMDDKDYVGNKRLELSGQLLSLLFEDLFKTMNDEVKKTVDATLAKPSRSSRFDFSQGAIVALLITLEHHQEQVIKLTLGGRIIKASTDDFHYVKFIVKDSITVGLERTLSTGNWDVKRFKMHRKGMTQVVARLSFIGTLGHMTKISPQFEKSRKVSGPRALQPSQWGMLCPCDTPEGEACGLVKNLALMTHVTTDEEEGPIVSLCYCLGVEDLELLSGEELHTPDSFLIILNGIILGKHRRPQRFANAMRKLRRAGKIGEFVSVFVNEKQHCVYIASDGGRVCRPLVIADNGVSRIKEHHMKELLDGVRCFDDFLREGLIEYLDVNEENNALIALYEGEATFETTHIEIEPFTILGVCAGLIPFPHHNQSPRNTYQCAMGKQAMGNIAYNQLCRMDTLIYLLVYPQRPLLTTRTIELVGYDKLGAGQNATVAVMSYSGYDIEDAIVMNKASLDRGFGRCIVMKKLSAINQKYENNSSDRIIRPQREGHDAERMQSVLTVPVLLSLVNYTKEVGIGLILDDDGLAAPGEIIRPNDIYINKQSPIVTRGAIVPPMGLNDKSLTGIATSRQYKPSRQTYKGPEGETAVVDRVALCSDKNNNLCIKFMIRHTRRPEVGDKFSSRHGQKGVCGTIIQQEDFPFSERGICPDLIMNPHGFPSKEYGISEDGGYKDEEVFDEPTVKFGVGESMKFLRFMKSPIFSGFVIQQGRMTVGKMIELLGSKAGVSSGKFHYGSAFGEPSGHADRVEAISETLVKHGFSYSGKDFIYSGITGLPLQTYIFMGPIYYQKLKHMVLDKMHARGSGPRVMITRQPTEGRSRNGGLRVGEMERDCLIAYGTSMLIFERLMISSDPFKVQVCRKCGLLGYYNHKLKTSICSTCKNGENVSTMKLPYACKLLFQRTSINEYCSSLETNGSLMVWAFLPMLGVHKLRQCCGAILLELWYNWSLATGGVI